MSSGMVARALSAGSDFATFLVLTQRMQILKGLTRGRFKAEDGKPQSLCLAWKWAVLLAGGHPASECAPCHLCLWDMEEQMPCPRLVSPACSFLFSLPIPTLPKLSAHQAHAFRSQHTEFLHCPGLRVTGPTSPTADQCPGPAPGGWPPQSGHDAFTALVYRSSKFWREHQRVN